MNTIFNSVKLNIINPHNVKSLKTKNKLEKTINTNNNIIAWKTREIVFREDKMSDVIHIQLSIR